MARILNQTVLASSINYNQGKFNLRRPTTQSRAMNPLELSNNHQNNPTKSLPKNIFEKYSK